MNIKDLELAVFLIAEGFEKICYEEEFGWVFARDERMNKYIDIYNPFEDLRENMVHASRLFEDAVNI